jgi:hypothetical protein
MNETLHPTVLREYAHGKPGISPDEYMIVFPVKKISRMFSTCYRLQSHGTAIA